MKSSKQFLNLSTFSDSNGFMTMIPDLLCDPIHT